MSAITRRSASTIFQVGRYITRTFASDSTPTTKEDYVILKESGGVRSITMNHPASRNSLSMEMMETLLDSIKKDEQNESLRSIVITSVPGKIFCAGHNLKELTTRDGGSKRHKEIFNKCSELMQAIIHSPVPVIAAVDGLAAAAGCQLVAACDIAVCTERSSFSTPGANFGIFCSTPGIPLVRNVPRKTAMYMLFTGFQITGKEAYETGLVSRVVPDGKLDEEITRITTAINGKSRSVVHIGKTFLYEQMDLDISTAYFLGAEKMLMSLSRRLKRSCMRFGASGRRYECRRQRKINAPVIVKEKEIKKRDTSKVFTKKRVAELLFDICIDCGRMAAIPQGAFAASKVRRNQEYGTLISAMEGKEGSSKQNVYNARSPSEGWEPTPLKYNSKLMNSIWGLYNRYSVHNFKKNTDDNGGAFTAVWEAVQAHPSVVDASVVTSATTTKTSQFFSTGGNGL